MIKVGDTLPAGTLMEFIEVEGNGCSIGPNPVPVAKAAAGKTVALFALPGAFTPTCSAKHVPGYLEKFSELKAAGVDVLFDDRKERPGVMFADMELLGVPHAIVIGDRGLDNGVVEITAKISVRMTEWVKGADGEFTPETKLVDTTVGRALLSEILPKGLPFSNINKALKKKEISRLINVSFRNCFDIIATLLQCSLLPTVHLSNPHHVVSMYKLYVILDALVNINI